MSLLPCAHCGSTLVAGPILELIGENDNRFYRHWRIGCTNCPSSMRAFGETPSAIETAWNRRVEREADK